MTHLGNPGGFDFLASQSGFATPVPTATNADNDLDVDSDHLAEWESQFGTVSAPAIAAASGPATASFPESQSVAPAIEPLSTELVDAAITMENDGSFHRDALDVAQNEELLDDLFADGEFDPLF